MVTREYKGCDEWAPISVLTAINVLSIGFNQGVYKYKNIKRLFAKIEPEGLNWEVSSSGNCTTFFFK